MPNLVRQHDNQKPRDRGDFRATGWHVQEPRHSRLRRGVFCCRRQICRTNTKDAKGSSITFREHGTGRQTSLTGQKLTTKSRLASITLMEERPESSRSAGFASATEAMQLWWRGRTRGVLSMGFGTLSNRWQPCRKQIPARRQFAIYWCLWESQMPLLLTTPMKTSLYGEAVRSTDQLESSSLSGRPADGDRQQKQDAAVTSESRQSADDESKRKEMWRGGVWETRPWMARSCRVR